MADGKNITLIFYACQVGATETIVDNKLVTRTPLAKVFSKTYPNVTVIAPNGVLIFGFNNGKAEPTAIHPARGEGRWITYRNGQIISHRKIYRW